MPSLKTTLLMDAEQFDAALVHSRAAAAVAGRDITRSLTMKIEGMQANIARMPQGAARLAAEESLAAAKMKLAVATQRSITALEIAENEKRIASDRAYYVQWAALSASARMRSKVADRVEAATAAFSAAGGSQYAPQNVRDELAQAIRAQRALRDFGDAAGSAHGKIPGLNLVLRETLVIFREIGRGNWARVPGSFSLVLQGLRSMRSELGPLGALFTLTGAITVAAIGGIVASFFIWRHRVNELTQDLSNLARVDYPKPDIGRLSAYEEGWRRIKDAIAEASDEINSANARFATATKLMDQAQSTERRLLEIRKQKDMDKAGDDPAKKAAVRIKYLKEEHDLEAKQLNERLAADAKHIQDLQAEQNAKTAQAKAMKVMTKEDEQSQEKYLQDQVAKNNEREKDKHGNAVEGTSALEKAQATVDELTAKQHQHAYAFQPVTGAAIDLGEQGLSDTDQARLAAAQGKLTQGQQDQQKLNEFQRAKADREAARKEQDRLFAAAAAAGGDKVKSEKAYNDALALNKRILKDDDTIRGASADEKDSRPGRGAGRNNLNADQRIGAYAGQSHNNVEKLLEDIKMNTKHLAPPAHPPVGTNTRPTYGGMHQ